jgi:chemotaxis-related protein WspD
MMSNHENDVHEMPSDNHDASPADNALQRLLDRPLSEDALREQTDRVSQLMEEADREGTRVLLFELGRELLALPAGDVARVTGRVQEHRVPHRTNDIYRGLCNIDGELVLCGDLASLLRVTRKTAQKDDEDDGDDPQRTLVLGDLDNRWAFTVDIVRGVARIEPGAIQPPPITVERALIRYTDSIVQAGKEQAALLSTERVVSGFMAALK